MVKKSILSKIGPLNALVLFFMNLLQKFRFDHWIEHQNLSLKNNFQIYISKSQGLVAFAKSEKIVLPAKFILLIKQLFSIKHPNILPSKWSVFNCFNTIRQNLWKCPLVYIFKPEAVGGLQKTDIATWFSRKLHVRFSWNFFYKWTSMRTTID